MLANCIRPKASFKFVRAFQNPYGSNASTPFHQRPPMSTTNNNHSGGGNSFVIAKPRMRICFDPETEIPRLQKWFAQNNHPTRQQVSSVAVVLTHSFPHNT